MLLNLFYAVLSEANLVRQYLAKDRKYRKKLSPFPLPEKASFYSDWEVRHMYAPRQNAKCYTSVSFGDWRNKLSIGEPFHNSGSYRNPAPSLWAFVAGKSGNGTIYGMPSLTYGVNNISTDAEQPIAFWNINGSWHADFNYINNLARAILARSSYGLVAIPNSNADNFAPAFQSQAMALGETVGTAFIESVNLAFNAYQHRWLNIQGAPTLRLHTITPPTLTSVTTNGLTVNLSWSPGESGSWYHIYRSAGTNGPFQLLTSSGPTNAVNYSATNDATRQVYMVRGTMKTTTGCGTYTNLSQGSLRAVQLVGL